MLKRIIALILIFGSLILGLEIYIYSRANDLVLHEVLRRSELLGFDREATSLVTKLNLPGWILNSLPDGLWMFALSLAILLIWRFRINRNSILWLCIALIVGLTLEFLQVTGFMPGTFDWLDVAFIVVGALLPVVGGNWQEFRDYKTICQR